MDNCRNHIAAYNLSRAGICAFNAAGVRHNRIRPNRLAIPALTGYSGNHRQRNHVVIQPEISKTTQDIAKHDRFKEKEAKEERGNIVFLKLLPTIKLLSWRISCYA